MLDVADPCLDEAGSFDNLHLAQAALVTNGADSLAESLGIGWRAWHRPSRFAVG